ncbi:MAG: hypothetical protein ACKVS8_08040 [Phycisphaerales bacterium]
MSNPRASKLLAARAAAAALHLALIAAASHAGVYALATDQQAPAARAPLAAPATRTDFVRAYLRFERTLADAKTAPTGPRRVTLHRGFDDLAGDFLRGDTAGAIARLEALTRTIDPQAPALDLPPRTALARPANELRASLSRRLDLALAAHPELRLPADAARSRIGLIVDEFNENITIQLLSDPAVIAREVAAEIDTLAAGTNPYQRRLGDWWRSIHVSDGLDLPTRIFAPDAASFARRPPLPLVIALHGAGGDENMFMEAYGRGKLKALAQEHGFLVASPSTTVLASNPLALDALFAALHEDYGLDDRRVYLVGHSMGAGAAALLAGTRRDMIAAAACLAGGPQRAPTGPLAPMLVWGADQDPIIPARRLRAAALDGARAALPIEYRENAGAGHTLMVPEVLAEAVAWLLKHQRAPEPPAQP